MIRVAINGFGRIGRRVFRLLQDYNNIEVIAINDLADSKTLSHLLKYDSIHGVFNGTISHDDHHIIANHKKVALLNANHPKNIDWKPFEIDFVIESTGKFKTSKDLQYHINNGAKKVILSVPPLDENIKTVVIGVNDKMIDGIETI
ncbi:MAG: glyceraldehyde 3-phosphate dehydrogenase NAD-binding domain-containing protein, partial [Flavobacteriales bacterium]